VGGVISSEPVIFLAASIYSKVAKKALTTVQFNSSGIELLRTTLRTFGGQDAAEDDAEEESDGDDGEERERGGDDGFEAVVE
jgi:hypothetical protein